MIDTKALRSRVLDLAIQGKLTEQLASDGEASDNCNGIKMQSANAPFSIPNNWKWTTIGNVILKDLGGGTPSKTVKEYWDGGTIPWMSVKDFSSARNGVLEDTKDHITELGLQNSTSNLIDTEAIIICVRMGLGRLVKLKKPTAINQDLRAIWLSDCINRDYFMYFYSTLRVEGHGMTVSGIKKQELMNFRLPLPPLAEQKRIVARVEEIFRLLDIIDAAQEQYAADAESLKAKLITAGIQGRLTEQLQSDGTAEELWQQIQAEKQRLIKEGKLKKEKPLPEISEDEIPFEIPGNWKWVRFESVINMLPGYAFKSKEFLPEGKYRLLRGINLGVGCLRWDDTAYFNDIPAELEAYKLFDGDVLLGLDRPWITGGIRVAVYKETSDDTLLVQRVLKIRETFAIDKRYIVILLHSEMFKNAIEPWSTGISVPHISHKQVGSCIIPLPPLAEQKRIAETLERVLGVL